MYSSPPYRNFFRGAIYTLNKFNIFFFDNWKMSTKIVIRLLLENFWYFLNYYHRGSFCIYTNIDSCKEDILYIYDDR